MKKALIILLFITSSTVMAQNAFGVKAGLNYGDNGEIEFEDISRARDTESKVGYHFGAYYRAVLGGFYLKPELLYTKTKSSYNYNNREADYDISKLDLPILLGVRVLGPIHAFAGPSLQYILDNDLEGVTLGDVENEFTIGVQFGAGFQFSGIGLDVRYERGLTENQARALDLNNPDGVQRIDARPNQFILSLSLDL